MASLFYFCGRTVILAMMRLGLIHGWTLYALLTIVPNVFAGGTARYFVLVVWDGMRPDFVSAELTPALQTLRESGVWFANHHSVYPTSTEVNGTVLATGVFPQRSGITANKEYRHEIDPRKPFGTQSLQAVRRGDELTGGKYLKVLTVAEMVKTAGGRTAVVGAKPVALLHDRRARPAGSASQVWFVEGSLPETLFGSLTNRFGSFPAATYPNVPRDIWATRCLTEAFWKKEMPRYSVLWLSEPDYSQHEYGPGSPQALAAIRNCDQRLATVLAELDRRGIREQTDLFVASDHGFSTIGQNEDVAATLRAAGINARPAWDESPMRDDVVVVGNGGSVLLYVTGHARTVIDKIVSALQQHPDSGVVFTRAGIPGTFKLAEAMLDSPSAPDVIVASTWRLTNEGNRHQRNEVSNDGYSEYTVGGGMHVTLSPTDLHNLAIAAGPDFRRGVTSPLPSGNVDIVPTLLWLMDIQPRVRLDGRVLSEALRAKAPPAPEAKPGLLKARRDFANGTWEQYLRFTEVNGVRYLEEGNGNWQPRSQLFSPGSKKI